MLILKFQYFVEDFIIKEELHDIGDNVFFCCRLHCVYCFMRLVLKYIRDLRVASCSNFKGQVYGSTIAFVTETIFDRGGVCMMKYLWALLQKSLMATHPEVCFDFVIKEM